MEGFSPVPPGLQRARRAAEARGEGRDPGPGLGAPLPAGEGSAPSPASTPGPLPVVAPLSAAPPAKPVLGYLHSVETGGTVDGPGIRYVAFLQGCPLRCVYCHNPDSWRQHAGKVISPAELVADVDRYRKFTRHGGLTLSGGEPLMQTDFVEAVLELCRRRDIHTALDTSGIIPVAKSQRALELCDLVILDIKALDRELAKKVTGSSNKNALATLDFLEELGKPVWIRHVVVPGLTDEPEQIRRLAAYLQPYRCIEKVELLPFHQMATYKWEALGLTYTLKDRPVPTKDAMAGLNGIIQAYGLPR